VSQILVVDDEADIRALISEILSDEGYGVTVAGNAEEARTARGSSKFDLILLDIWMPDTDGITLLKQWSDQGALKCPVVMMSGHGTVETAVEATRLGATDFIEKPLSLAQLLSTVESALQDVPANPTADVQRTASPPEMPQGKTAVMEAARKEASEIAQHDAPTLISGEAGSGRSLFAHYIHGLSARADRPFVAVNGATLTDDAAVEHLIGRATGEPSLLTQANGGTLFISELQGLSPKAQSFLVSVIEQGGYTRAGNPEPEAANLRVMASVHGGEGLRPDLLAALGVMQLSVPALREYSDDVPALLRFYTGRLNAMEGLDYRRFGVATQNRLRNYPWPGNLRELKSLVRKLLMAGDNPDIGLDELELCLISPLAGGEPLVKQDLLALPMREAREQFERAYLKQQLALCGAKVGKLAERVGMERTHLYRKLRSLGIDFRQGGSDD
jgi:two-component system nitrogen regulation response regulator NtrX